MHKLGTFYDLAAVRFRDAVSGLKETAFFGHLIELITVQVMRIHAHNKVVYVCLEMRHPFV